MRKLLIATANPGKFKEYKILLKNLPIKLVNFKDLGIRKKIREDGKTFEENAIKKAKFYSKLTNIPTLADDGGLEIDYLNGEPGLKSRRWPGREATDAQLVKFCLEKLKEVPWQKRKAQFRVIIALAIPKKNIFVSEGKKRGIITTKPRGKIIPGYPFRSIFYLPQSGKTFNEISFRREVEIGHRKKAIKKLIPILLGLTGLSA